MSLQYIQYSIHFNIRLWGPRLYIYKITNIQFSLPRYNKNVPFRFFRSWQAIRFMFIIFRCVLYIYICKSDIKVFGKGHLLLTLTIEDKVSFIFKIWCIPKAWENISDRVLFIIDKREKETAKGYLFRFYHSN